MPGCITLYNCGNLFCSYIQIATHISHYHLLLSSWYWLFASLSGRRSAALADFLILGWMQSPRSATALPSHDSYVIQISKLGQFGLNMMVFVCIVSAYFSPIVMNVIVNVCDPSVSKDLSIFVPIPRGDSTVSSLRRSFCFPSAALAIHCPFGVPGGRLASANRRT